LSASVKYDVTSPYSWEGDVYIPAGQYACNYTSDGTCETYRILHEDDEHVSFERIQAHYSTWYMQCEGFRETETYRKTSRTTMESVPGTNLTYRFRVRSYDDQPKDNRETVARVLAYIEQHTELEPVQEGRAYMGIWPVQEVNVKSKLPNPSYAFLVGELGYEVYGRELSPVILPAMRDAYLKGVESFPKAADNNIANFMEIGEMIFDALHGDLSSVPETLGGLWMWYRYQYNTTKSDVQQAMDYWDRLKSGIELGAKYHGVVKIRLPEAENAEVRWSGDVRLNTDDMQALMEHRLWSAGLEPTLYTGWDLVPFSFMADWFLDIGDKLEGMDQKRHAYADYIVSNSCYSFRYTRRSDAGPVLCYYRFYAPPKQAYGECFYSSSGRSSLATWLKRAGDTAVISGADQKVSNLLFRVFK
jgi:hypothetical protein